ncbi:MAG: rod shape-determining protein MreC [Oscillospiraceae bacterium]|nr:rod shape-determining protein MreC [Oscillospiraceae bacterium]MDD4413914.1 rod shape-determining protein MreC [Oscillospiraceae bacterium]
MKNFIKSGAFKALAVVALFLIGMMIYAASTGGVSSIPATLTGAIVSPLQSLGAAISNGFDDFIGIFTDSKELRKQNEKLQNEVNELRDKQVELDDLRRRNELYLQYLELKEQNPDYKFADCRVIYIDPNNKYGNFTINAGQLNGVEANQPVITPNGLVGVTYEVGLNFAKVRTILDPATQVSAAVSRTNSGGVTGGSLSLAQQGILRLNYLQRNSGIATGDYVVTSGKGGIYPSNLRIGSISEVNSESDGLTIYALIEPFVNIRDVTDVFVITGFDQAQEDG